MHITLYTFIPVNTLNIVLSMSNETKSSNFDKKKMVGFLFFFLQKIYAPIKTESFHVSL